MAKQFDSLIEAIKKGRKLKISFDAGHSRNTAGKRTPDGEREWDFNNKVLLAFVGYMKQFPNIELLRTDDPNGQVDIPLITRTNKANAWGADIYISFHHNANAGVWGTHTGVETYVYTVPNAKSDELANAVHGRYVQAMGLKDRGTRRKNLHIVRETKMPAILLEGGFMDSTIDIKQMRNDKVLENAGIEVAKGIAEHFELQSVKTASKPELKKEEVKLYQPSHKEFLNDTLIVLRRLEKKEKDAIDPQWRQKLINGELTDSDAIGLLYTAFKRGLIQGDMK